MAVGRARATDRRLLPPLGAHAGIDYGARLRNTLPETPDAYVCACCGKYVELERGLRCVNAFHEVVPTGGDWTQPFPPCRSVYCIECYKVDSNDWPSVLTASTHKQRGRGARAHDASVSALLCARCAACALSAGTSPRARLATARARSSASGS